MTITKLVPLEGAYYATIGYEKLFFSHFREEDDSIFTRVAPLDETIESKILTDTNLATIKSAPDYQTNTSPMTPTHRMLTSLFSKDRMLFLLRYGLAYVERTDDNGIKHLEKHVMRYPQIFATKAIEEKLNHNDKHGVIWHTQGSRQNSAGLFQRPLFDRLLSKAGHHRQVLFHCRSALTYEAGRR